MCGGRGEVAAHHFLSGVLHGSQVGQPLLLPLAVFGQQTLLVDAHDLELKAQLIISLSLQGLQMQSCVSVFVCVGVSAHACVYVWVTLSM